jgi:uncharacterized membrane protein
MDNMYLILKSLHILGVILLIGNVIITGWWKVMADRTGDPRVLAFAQRQVTLTDWVFTAGGVVLVGATGTLNGYLQGPEFFALTWVVWGYALFIAAGAIWVVVLIPIQMRQARMAREFSPGSPIPAKYRRLSRLWAVSGTLTTVLLLGNIYWMVFKPL